VRRSSWGYGLFPGTSCASALFECLLLQVCWRPRACPVLLLLFPCVPACMCLWLFLLRAFSLVCGNFRHWFRFLARSSALWVCVILCEVVFTRVATMFAGVYASECICCVYMLLLLLL